jgi:hypothetical protein
MQRILDFQSFLNEGYTNEAQSAGAKDIVVRIGNEIGSEGEDQKSNVLYIDLSDSGVDVSKFSDKASKSSTVGFGSKEMASGEQNVWTKVVKIPIPEGDAPEKNVLAKNPMEAKQKAYNILGYILSADQVGEGTFKFQPEKVKQILKSLFMLRKDPKAVTLISNNPVFDGFLKGLAINSNEAGTIASSLGEYKNAIDPKKMQELFRSAADEINK